MEEPVKDINEWKNFKGKVILLNEQCPRYLKNILQYCRDEEQAEYIENLLTEKIGNPKAWDEIEHAGLFQEQYEMNKRFEEILNK